MVSTLASEKGRRKAPKRKRVPWILLVLGLLALAFPSLAKMYTAQQDSHVMEAYRTQELTPEQEAAQAAAIDAYNRTLAEGAFNAAADPWSQPNEERAATSVYLGSGEILFILHIPTLNLELPVRYGTSAQVLALGAGLLENTNVPGTIGGNATISAHRGLYNRGLFFNLDELEIGDPIYIETTTEVLKYEVTGSQVVLPSETSVIEQVPGRDLLTLLTCHPYPINDHRLIYTADRVPISDEEIAAINPDLASDGTTVDPGSSVLDLLGIIAEPWVAITVFILAFILGWWFVIARRRKKASEEPIPEGSSEAESEFKAEL